ncbi:MAG: 3-hydroxyacyl-ACP dehydratase FabZ [Eubacteriales bacterium]|nr:3-hydroxyacyl-ACP dehydratase FabZ [Eubacteriales bacterium]
MNKKMDKTMNLEDIKQILPHREPFLLIDEVVELEEGKRCVALKHLTGEEFWWPGHFPGQPVMPGVLQIEAMAQTGAVALLSLPDYRGKTAFFGGIKKARFRKMVVPGDTLRFEVELVKCRGPVGFGEGRAFIGEELAVEAEISFVIG